MQATTQHPATRALTWRECAAHALLLLVILALLFPGTFLRGEIIFPAGLLFTDDPYRPYTPEGAQLPRNEAMLDVVMGWGPYYQWSSRCFERGEWPLWNPFSYCGVPFLANYQSAVFYPPRLLFLFMEHYRAFSCFILLRFWLCGATAFVCGRLLGLRTGAAQFLSVGWMLCGYNLLWSHWVIIDAAAWVPVLFLGAEWVLSGRYRKGLFATLAGGALLLLAGHPESAFASSLGLAVYFFLRLAFARSWGRNLWKPLVTMAAAWAVILLAVAAQLVPFLENMAQSHTFAHRSQAEGAEHVKPIIPAGAVTAFWVPRFFGSSADGNRWELTRRNPFDPGRMEPFNSNFVGVVYPGIAASLALSLLLHGGVRRRAGRARLAALAVPMILGFLLAFDHASVGAVNRLPLLNSMWRLYHAHFPMFALLLLAAIALHHWFEQPRRLRDVLPALVVPALGAACVVLMCYMHHPTIRAEGLGGYIGLQVALAAAFLLAALGALALNCVLRRPAVLASALAMVLATDLVVASRNYLPTAPRSYTQVEPELIQFMRDLPKPVRFSLATAQFRVGITWAYDIHHIYGYEGLVPERFQRFLSTCYPGSWDWTEPLLATEYYLFRAGAREPDDVFEPVTRLDGFDVFRNRRALPRAFLVEALEVVPDADALFDRMCAPGFDPSATALTEAPPAGPLPGSAPTGAPPGEAVVTKHWSNTIEVEVDAPGPRVLVLADSYFPGWNVRIDETPAALFPVYHAFRGLLVPPGKHVVRYAYRPAALRVGLAVSAVVLAAGACAALVITVRERRSAVR